jgi:hypothetical protein
VSNIQNYLITLSLLCWFFVVVYELVQKKYERKIGGALAKILLINLVAFGLYRYFGYFNALEIKGDKPIAEHWTLIGLYLCAVLGIVAHHVFIQIKEIDDKNDQPKIKWFPLLKPLIISPIIFIAVWSQLSQMGVQGQGLKANITQFVFAFQNGFFWKTIYEKLEHKKVSSTKSKAS